MLLTFSFLYHRTLKKKYNLCVCDLWKCYWHLKKKCLGHFAMKSADSYSPSFKQAVVLLVLLMLLCQSAE